MSSRESARRFHFLREIASGGFGSVYLAKAMHADGFSRLVAIKLLKAQWSDNDDVTRRIRDEARLLGLLRHRNIVDVIDLTSIDGRTAVIMEYLEAVDFRAVTQHLHDTGARMPVRAALEAVSAVASALDAAYNRPPIPGDKPLRVIHRDIKPSNIMVDETGMVKVLDFGVARSEIENRESHTQELQFGSLDYMATERLFFEPETPASDVYSLGVTLYELLALEKLGKARGRPEKHASFLEDRLSALGAALQLEPGAWTGLSALMRDSLDFAHEKRPSAAEFFQRTRALARLAQDEDLGQWAERVLPPLVKAASEAPREPNALVDVILPEDVVALPRPAPNDMEALVSTGIRNVGAAVTSLSPAMPPPMGDQLRRGALAELEDSIARGFAPQPATGAPFRAQQEAPIAQDAPGLVEDDWTELPTRVEVAPQAPKPDVLDEPTLLAAPMEAPPPKLAAAAPPPQVRVVEEESDALDVMAAIDAEDSAVLAAEAAMAMFDLQHPPAGDAPGEDSEAVDAFAAMDEEDLRGPTVAADTEDSGVLAAEVVFGSSMLAEDEPVAPSPLDVPEPSTLRVTERSASQWAPPAPSAEPPPLPVFPPVPGGPADRPARPAWSVPPEPYAWSPAAASPAQSAAPVESAPPLESAAPEEAPTPEEPQAPAEASAPLDEPAAPPPMDASHIGAVAAAEGWFMASDQRPQPEGLDAPDPRPTPQQPPPQERSVLPYAFLGGCFIGLLGVVAVGVAVALDVGGLKGRLLSARRGEVAAAEAPAEAPREAPTEAPSAPEAPPPASTGPATPELRFLSDAPGTSRVSAECTGGSDSRKGSTAVVAAESSDSCMVTAILEDRSRLRATVTGASAGTYRCFVGGKEACAKE